MTREVPCLFAHSVLDTGDPYPYTYTLKYRHRCHLEEGGSHEARLFPACLLRYTRTPSAHPPTGTPVQCEQTVRERVADRPCVTADIQGAVGGGGAGASGMALHSFPCRLINLNRFCHCIDQHILAKVFRLSRKVEECKPLGSGAALLAGTMEGDAGGACVRVHWYTMSKQSGCAKGKQQIVRGRVEYSRPGSEDAASVHGYTGTLRANSQGTSSQAWGGAGRASCVRVHRYTTSKQSGDGRSGPGRWRPVGRRQLFTTSVGRCRLTRG